MKLVVVALVLLPIVLAAVITATRHSRPVMQGGWLAIAGLAASASVMGVVAPTTTVMLGRTPWDSDIGFVFGAPASILVILVYWSVVVVYLAPVWRPNADGPPHGIALTWCLCGAICAGLLVNDLLARVVILDLVSVSVALQLLIASPDRLQPSAIWHYAVLRLGDMGFLLVALLLAQMANTMSISTAFGLAAETRGVQQILLVYAGLLAVWIKMGLAPASGWLQAASTLPAPQRILVLSAGPPLLGAYLLYRLQPSIAAMGRLGIVVLAPVAVLALPSLLGAMRPGQKPILRSLALHSVLGLVACLTLNLGTYLLAFVPLRMALCLIFREPAPQIDKQGAAVALDLPRRLETLATAAARIETGLENMVSALGHWPQIFGAVLQRAHTGKLRLNLLWPVLGLIPVLVALLVAVLGQAP